jgi:hypothetical protein
VGDEAQSSQRCPLLALSGHRTHVEEFPLLGVKQTLGEGAAMSAFDPKRTWTLCDYKVIHGSRAKLVIGLIAAESASISRNAANE